MSKDNFLTTDTGQRTLLGICIIIFLWIIFLLFGKIHCVIFTLLLFASYKLTDYYVLSLNDPNKSPRYWPNLLILFDPLKDADKPKTNSQYIKKNPWVHLMLSKKIDNAIDELCCLCLRDHIYPWLSLITHDDTFVYSAKHGFRFFLATVIRRIQNVDINAFMLERFLPLIFQTSDRYIHTVKKSSQNESQSSTEFVKKVFKSDLHVAMYSRQSELKYLKRIILDLMPIIIPKPIYECKGTRHILSELITCQMLLDGIDAICEPDTLNRLFHLYFITDIKNRYLPKPIPVISTDPSVELLTRFCSMNGPLHKNQLALELTDVMYEKELMSQFSRVLDRNGAIGLLSIYITLSDVLNDIPSASNLPVRKRIYQRLKNLDELYLNPTNIDAFVNISNPYDKNDILIDEIKDLIYNHLEKSLTEDKKDDSTYKNLDISYTFTLLSRFHCKIYELVEEKYQRCFLTSDEHFLYICGRRMDSPDYRISEKKNANENSRKRTMPRQYTTTSYQELEEKEDANLKCPEDTTSIGSNSSSDEKDLNTWRVRVTHATELRESLNSSVRYCVFIIEVQRMDPNNENTLINDEEKTHWIVARRYQDFYLLEQKLTEFHGVFSDARLPPRRSIVVARNLDFLESIKPQLEHFLRHLLMKPTLRNSELLHNFLTQPDDFTLPNGEINISKMFRGVPRRFRTEKGQYLDPFLVSLINYAEPAKPKSTPPAPEFSDIVEEKLQNSMFGNNANITASTELPKIEQSSYDKPDSVYDHVIVVAKELFSASPLVIHLLDLLRIPLKNSFDSFFAHYVDEHVDEVIADEENYIDVIHALRDVVFPNDAENKGPTDLVNFEDLVAAAEEFLPWEIKLIFGKSKVQQGLQMLLQYFQSPLLNKQLFYMILDEVLLQVFPELQAHSEITNTHLK